MNPRLARILGLRHERHAAGTEGARWELFAFDVVGCRRGCREVFQFAVDAHGDNVPIGEQLEAGRHVVNFTGTGIPPLSRRTAR